MHYYPSRRTFLRTSAAATLSVAAAPSFLRAASPTTSAPTSGPTSSPTSAPTIHRPPTFFGVNIDAPYPPDQVANYPHLNQALADARLGAVRTSIGWRYAEPAKGKFNWDQTDDGLARLPKDVDILMLLLSTPDWSSGVDPAKTVGWFDTYMPKDMHDWGNFVYQAVSRYRGRVKHWEMWNEENGIDFFHPQPDAKVYVELLKTGHDAAKRADPDCKVVLGGLQMNGVVPNPGSPVKTPNFLQAIYEAGGGPYFDICNTHPYVGRIAGAKYLMELTRDTRKVMAQFGDAKKPLWITETGAPADAGTSEDQQAQLLADTYTLAAAPDSGIDRLYWFTFRDFPQSILGGENSMGIVTKDWKRKPAYEALRKLSAR